jgi:hypothetical protein
MNDAARSEQRLPCPIGQVRLSRTAAAKEAHYAAIKAESQLEARANDNRGMNMPKCFGRLGSKK